MNTDIEMTDWEKEQVQYLKPCPFCGKQVKLFLHNETIERFNSTNVIYCPNCNLYMSDKSVHNLEIKWNTRI